MAQSPPTATTSPGTTATSPTSWSEPPPTPLTTTIFPLTFTDDENGNTIVVEEDGHLCVIKPDEEDYEDFTDIADEYHFSPTSQQAYKRLPDGTEIPLTFLVPAAPPTTESLAPSRTRSRITSPHTITGVDLSLAFARAGADSGAKSRSPLSPHSSTPRSPSLPTINEETHAPEAET